MENSSSTGKVMGSLVLGALAGLTIGVLFASEKGAKLRNKLAKKAESITDEPKKKMSKEAKDFKKKLNKEVKMFKEETSKLNGFVKGKMHTAASILNEKAIGM